MVAAHIPQHQDTSGLRATETKLAVFMAVHFGLPLAPAQYPSEHWSRGL